MYACSVSNHYSRCYFCALTFSGISLWTRGNGSARNRPSRQTSIDDDILTEPDGNIPDRPDNVQVSVSGASVVRHPLPPLPSFTPPPPDGHASLVRICRPPINLSLPLPLPPPPHLASRALARARGAPGSEACLGASPLATRPAHAPCGGR